MKKKGFTLIEVLGVIVIIGILISLVIPTVMKSIEKREKNLYEIQIRNMKSALESFAATGLFQLPEKDDGQSITITLEQLKQSGLIESDIKNPVTGECFPDDMILQIIKKGQGYEYFVDEESGTKGNCSNKIDKEKGILLLKGNPVIYVEVNTGYVESGVIAKASNSTDLTSSVTITGSVDTTKIGTYQLKYKLNSGGVKGEIVRTVIVRDTIPPEITIPSDITVGTDATTYDLLEGVTVSDNSNGHVSIKVIGSLQFGVSGKTIITYVATDMSGNVTKVDRHASIIDRTNPTIEFSILDNPFNANGWAHKDINIRAIGDDADGSGTAKIKYCYSSTGECEPNIIRMGSRANILINKESKTNYVCAISVDLDNNESEKKCSGPHKLDKTGPVITMPNDTTIGTDITTINIMDDVVANDDLSNVKSLTGTGTVSLGTIGNYIINYVATDYAGNKTSVNRTITVEDNVAPTVILTLAGTPINSDNWSKTSVTYNITTTDTGGSNVWYYKYCTTSDLNANGCIPNIRKNASSGSVTVSDDSPNNIICAFAIDHAFNKSETVCTPAIRIDKNKPIVSLEATRDQFNINDWSRENVYVNVITEDVLENYSGVKSYKYCTTKDTECNPTTLVNANSGTIQTKQNSENNIACVIATDYAGNESEKTCLDNIRIDKIKPTVTMSVVGNPFNANNWANRLFRVKVTTSDTGSSDIEKFKYCYNKDGECEPDTWVYGTTGLVDITDESSTNYVCVYAYDLASNISDKTCSGPYKLDKTPPLITAAGDIILANTVSSYNPLDGVVAYDSLSGIDGDITSSGSISLGVPGVYRYTYSIADKAGNVSTTNKAITVEYTSVPSIALIGANPLYVEINNTYIESGASAIDDEGNNISGSITTTAPANFDTSVLGTYIINYSVTHDNLRRDVNRTVIVRDTTAPNLNIGNDVNIDSTVASYDLKTGVTATDNSNEAIEIKAYGTVSFGVSGTYEVTYKACDSSNNCTSKKKNFIIADKTKPVITLSTKTGSPNHNGWSKTDYVINIRTSDVGDGVSYYKYCTNQSTTCTPNLVRNQTSGDETLGGSGNMYFCAMAVDNAGNESDIKCVGPHNIDKQKPTTEIKAYYDGTLAESTSWAKESIRFDFEAKDTGGSTIEKFKYCTTTSTSCTPNIEINGTTSSAYVNTSSQTHYACIYAIDKAGNESDIKCVGPYRLDNALPTTIITIKETGKNANNWFKADTTGTITTTNNGGSSIKKITYCQSDNGTCTPNIDENVTTKTLTISAESDKNYICANATDTAGNTGKTTCNVIPVKIDKTAPTINLNRNVVSLLTTATEYNLLQGYTLTDNFSEASHINVSASGSIALGTEGSYTVTFKAVDLAGNESETTRIVNIIKNTYDFSATGSMATFKSFGAGKYKLEAWGAQGGGSTGGFGGYSTGTITLTDDEELYFYIGKQGTAATTGTISGGGYNGGGNSFESYGGGGMTHITTSKTDSLASTSTISENTSSEKAAQTIIATIDYPGKTPGSTWNDASNKNWISTYTMIASESKTVTFQSNDTITTSDPVCRIKVNGEIVASDDDSGEGNNFVCTAQISLGDKVSFEISSQTETGANVSYILDIPAGKEITTIVTTNDNISFDLAKLIMVAGGGGGSTNAISGGSGGGSTGGFTTVDGTLSSAYSATQTSGYKKGLGESSNITITNAGAGGGYYGGKVSNSVYGGAGGGSGYIGECLTNAHMACYNCTASVNSKNVTTSSESPTMDVAKRKDGHVRVTILSLD